MKGNLVYEAPKVEIVEVQVEKGFAASYYGNDDIQSNPIIGW